MLNNITEIFIAYFSKPDYIIVFFKKGFILCCLIKFISELSRGYFSYLNKDKFLRYIIDIEFGKNKYIKNIFFSEFSYKFINIIYLISLFYFLFNINSLFSILIIFLYLIYQNIINFKYHTCFFCLISFIIFIDGFLKIKSNYVNLWFTPILITSVTTSLYFFSALRKLFEKEFVSGFSLGITLKHLSKEGSKRIYRFDNIIGNIIKDRKFKFINIKYISILTIILEILIPIMLYFNLFKVPAIIIGIIMHLFFTLLEPRTLFHFSMLTILTYLLY